MDWTGIIVGAIMGAPIGYFVNTLTTRRQERLLIERTRQKYIEIVGNYTAYPFPEGAEVIDYGALSGRCEISYVSDNMLKLRYAEVKHDHVWEADIWMETPLIGSMAWQYIRLFGNEPPKEHRCGFKRCMVMTRPGQDGRMRTYFYFVGENGFGNEALEKAE